jgi:nitrite transporter NirC
MYQDSLAKILTAARAKLNFLASNTLGYFAASMLAGIYVGLGVVAYAIPGAAFAGMPGQKLLMGAVFSIALTLVVFAGAELFTGNNLVLSLAWLDGKAKAGEVFKLWGVCFLGNWLGGILLALMLAGSGFLAGDYGQFLAQTAQVKAAYPPLELILRGMLCNLLVCLAVWASYRLESESGKFIVILLCLGTFVAAGFEHVVANMTLLSAAVLVPHSLSLSIGGYLYNLALSGLGNILGAFLLLALPYWLASRSRQ